MPTICHTWTCQIFRHSTGDAPGTTGPGRLQTLPRIRCWFLNQDDLLSTVQESTGLQLHLLDTLECGGHSQIRLPSEHWGTNIIINHWEHGRVHIQGRGADRTSSLLTAHRKPSSRTPSTAGPSSLAEGATSTVSEPPLSDSGFIGRGLLSCLCAVCVVSLFGWLFGGGLVSPLLSLQCPGVWDGVFLSGLVPAYWSLGSLCSLGPLFSRADDASWFTRTGNRARLKGGVYGHSCKLGAFCRPWCGRHRRIRSVGSQAAWRRGAMSSPRFQGTGWAPRPRGAGDHGHGLVLGLRAF